MTTKSITLLTPVLRAMCALTLLGCAQAQAGNFTINEDNTVSDSATGLVWKRCAEGQTWDGITCNGTATPYKWPNALSTFAGQGGWRVPTVRELLTIVDYSASSPAVNKTVFPGTESSVFWTISPDLPIKYNFEFRSLGVNFADGNSGAYVSEIYSNGPNLPVRLVKGAPGLGLMNVARPNVDYTDLEDGTVTHKPTGLTWQRCLMGQNWTGGICQGSPSNYTFDEAISLTSNFANRSDWRLPNQQELQSLVDYQKVAPPLNVTQFPNASGSFTWSRTALANNSLQVWGVDFGSGLSTTVGRSNGYVVRMVRGSQVTSVNGTPTDTECFFDWAEARLPDLLKPAKPPTQYTRFVNFRAYVGGVYLGLGGASVMAVGGQFGADVQVIASTNTYLQAARAASCR